MALSGHGVGRYSAAYYPLNHWLGPNPLPKTHCGWPLVNKPCNNTKWYGSRSLWRNTIVVELHRSCAATDLLLVGFFALAFTMQCTSLR